MKRHILLSSDPEYTEDPTPDVPSSDGVNTDADKSNPTPADSNPPQPLSTTREQKEGTNMPDEMPQIPTSLFSTSTKNNEGDEWSALRASLAAHRGATETPEAPVPQQQPTPEVTTPPQMTATPEETDVSPLRTRKPHATKFPAFFNLPPAYSTRGPVASGQHIYDKENDKLIPIKGDAASYVHLLEMHLHGAIIQMGSSASNVQEKEGIDPALGVMGFLPQALEFLQKAAMSTKELSTENKDKDGRNFQFGVIAVLGGSDHDKITNTMLNKPSHGLIEALAQLGLVYCKAGYSSTKNQNFVDNYVRLTPVLYNRLGHVSALEVEFIDVEKYGEGKHYIYLHRANDIGGGKSDHSMRDGRTGFQAGSLAEEFEWWKAALALTHGKIGALESTLGGTARIARYALLQAKVPRALFSVDAVETILIDDAAWVKDNKGNMIHEYRANFATTLLRAAYGTFSKRMNNVHLDLANRFDGNQRRLRQTACIETVLRNLFPGEPKLDPMFQDISDERNEIHSQEDIIEAKQTTIVDPVEEAKGPWVLERQARVTASDSFSFGQIFDLAQGQAAHEAIEQARDMFTNVRGLATSSEGTLEAGGFCILDIYVPTEALNEDKTMLTYDMIESATQALTVAFEQAGSDKVLAHCHKVPGYFLPNSERVYVRLTEYQPLHNMLMVSNEDAGSRSKRTIMTDPNLDYIEDRHFAHVLGFARLFTQLIEGHRKSNYRYAEEDAFLLHAFYRHFYSNNFGNQPDLLLGGFNRPRKKKTK